MASSPDLSPPENATKLDDSLYPTHRDYVDKVTAATHSARAAGFVLPEEETTIVEQATSAAIPN